MTTNGSPRTMDSLMGTRQPLPTSMWSTTAGGQQQSRAPSGGGSFTSLPKLPPPPPPGRPPRPPQHHQNVFRAREEYNNNIQLPVRAEECGCIRVRASPLTTEYVKIFLSPGMTTPILSKCIEQSTQYLHGYKEPIAGLFRDSDGVYVPLDHLLRSNGRDQKEKEDNGVSSYSITRAPGGKSVKEPSSIMKFMPLIVVIVFIVGVVLMRGTIQEILTFWTIQINAEGYGEILTGPIRNIYRDGPKVLGGWEGKSLPEICADITGHGDSEFWIRNYPDCYRLYVAKEDAFVAWAKPTAQVLLSIITLYWLLKPRKSSMYATHKDIQDTYRAIQVLTHQSNRILHQKSK